MTRRKRGWSRKQVGVGGAWDDGDPQKGPIQGTIDAIGSLFGAQPSTSVSAETKASQSASGGAPVAPSAPPTPTPTVQTPRAPYVPDEATPGYSAPAAPASRTPYRLSGSDAYSKIKGMVTSSDDPMVGASINNQGEYDSYVGMLRAMAENDDPTARQAWSRGMTDQLPGFDALTKTSTAVNTTKTSNLWNADTNRYEDALLDDKTGKVIKWFGPTYHTPTSGGADSTGTWQLWTDGQGRTWKYNSKSGEKVLFDEGMGGPNSEHGKLVDTMKDGDTLLGVYADGTISPLHQTTGGQYVSSPRGTLHIWTDKDGTSHSEIVKGTEPELAPQVINTDMGMFLVDPRTGESKRLMAGAPKIVGGNVVTPEGATPPKIDYYKYDPAGKYLPGDNVWKNFRPGSGQDVGVGGEDPYGDQGPRRDIIMGDGPFPRIKSPGIEIPDDARRPSFRRSQWTGQWENSPADMLPQGTPDRLIRTGEEADPTPMFRPLPNAPVYENNQIYGDIGPSDDPYPEWGPPMLNDSPMQQSRMGLTGRGADSSPGGWTPPVPREDVVGTGNKFGQPVDAEGIHKGTDLQAYDGSPIVSPVDGIVVAVTYDPKGLGVKVTIQDMHGNKHMLSHMQSDTVDVNIGDSVKAGDPVGRVGSTGNSTGPHLDYRIEDQQGNYENPEALMPDLASMPMSPDTVGGPMGSPMDPTAVTDPAGAVPQGAQQWNKMIGSMGRMRGTPGTGQDRGWGVGRGADLSDGWGDVQFGSLEDLPPRVSYGPESNPAGAKQAAEDAMQEAFRGNARQNMADGVLTMDDIAANNPRMAESLGNFQRTPLSAEEAQRLTQQLNQNGEAWRVPTPQYPGEPSPQGPLAQGEVASARGSVPEGWNVPRRPITAKMLMDAADAGMTFDEFVTQLENEHPFREGYTSRFSGESVPLPDELDKLSPEELIQRYRDAQHQNVPQPLTKRGAVPGPLSDPVARARAGLPANDVLDLQKAMRGAAEPVSEADDMFGQYKQMTGKYAESLRQWRAEHPLAARSGAVPGETSFGAVDPIQLLREKMAGGAANPADVVTKLRESGAFRPGVLESAGNLAGRAWANPWMAPVRAGVKVFNTLAPLSIAAEAGTQLHNLEHMKENKALWNTLPEDPSNMTYDQYRKFMDKEQSQYGGTGITALDLYHNLGGSALGQGIMDAQHNLGNAIGGGFDNARKMVGGGQDRGWGRSVGTGESWDTLDPVTKALFQNTYNQQGQDPAAIWQTQYNSQHPMNATVTQPQTASQTTMQISPDSQAQVDFQYAQLQAQQQQAAAALQQQYSQSQQQYQTQQTQLSQQLQQMQQNYDMAKQQLQEQARQFGMTYELQQKQSELDNKFRYDHDALTKQLQEGQNAWQGQQNDFQRQWQGQQNQFDREMTGWQTKFKANNDLLNSALSNSWLQQLTGWKPQVNDAGGAMSSAGPVQGPTGAPVPGQVAMGGASSQLLSGQQGMPSKGGVPQMPAGTYPGAPAPGQLPSMGNPTNALSTGGNLTSRMGAQAGSGVEAFGGISRDQMAAAKAAGTSTDPGSMQFMDQAQGGAVTAQSTGAIGSSMNTGMASGSTAGGTSQQSSGGGVPQQGPGWTPTSAGQMTMTDLERMTPYQRAALRTQTMASGGQAGWDSMVNGMLGNSGSGYSLAPKTAMQTAGMTDMNKIGQQQMIDATGQQDYWNQQKKGWGTAGASNVQMGA